jgi:hypothetical protein
MLKNQRMHSWKKVANNHWQFLAGTELIGDFKQLKNNFTWQEERDTHTIKSRSGWGSHYQILDASNLQIASIKPTTWYGSSLTITISGTNYTITYVNKPLVTLLLKNDRHETLIEAGVSTHLGKAVNRFEVHAQLVPTRQLGLLSAIVFLFVKSIFASETGSDETALMMMLAASGSD